MADTFWLPEYTPDRVLLSVGNIQVYWYGVAVVAGIGVAYWLARAQYRARSGSDKDLSDLLMVLLLSGFVGARLWHVFVFHWEYYSAHLLEIVQIWRGGLAIQGALAGGCVGILAFARRRRLSAWTLTDLTALVLPVGQAIGRMGNFFNQELYGRPTEAVWSIYIAPDNRLPGYERYSRFHPAFAYEALLNAVLFFVLWRLYKKKPREGILTAAYLIGYGLIRLGVEFVRIDPMPLVLGARLSQLVSLLLVCAGVALLLLRYRQKQPRIAKK